MSTYRYIWIHTHIYLIIISKEEVTKLRERENMVKVGQGKRNGNDGNTYSCIKFSNKLKILIIKTLAPPKKN